MTALTRPAISLVAPAHNEEGNIESLVEQVGRTGPELARLLEASETSGFEFVLVDDGSTDRTQAKAVELSRTRPWLRVVAMTRTPPGRGGGQSAAFYAGFRACRAPLIAVLDADLQNDPADLPAMLQLMLRERADMVQGDRSRTRRDHVIRKAGSWVGRAARGLILGDSIRDTGCSLRILRADLAVKLPLEFRGMHRFIPVAARQLGAVVVEMPVSHRPRVAGTTKYGMGVMTRAIPGLIDCFAVRWMSARRRPTDHLEVSAQPLSERGGDSTIMPTVRSPGGWR